MKKKHIAIVCIIILVSALILSGCQQLNAKSEGNEIIEEWLVENIQEVDAYRFELITEVYGYDETGNENVNVSIDDIPTTTTTHAVMVSKIDKKAKIELTDREYYYPSTNETLTETYTDIVYYLSVEDDVVSIYIPDGGGSHTVQSYQDQETADAISAILFPDDVAFLQGDIVQSIFSEDSNPYLNLERKINSEPFYIAFKLMNDTFQEQGDIYLSFILMHEPYSVWTFSMGSDRMNDYYGAVSEVLTGEPYTNEFIENGYTDDITIFAYFYEDRFAVEDFKLPNAE